MGTVKRVAGDPMGKNPPAGGSGQSSNVGTSGGAAPPPSGAEEPSYDGRNVSLKMALDNLKALKAGMSKHIEDLEGFLQEALTYADDSRSHVDGPDKEKWRERVKGTMNSMKNSMKAVEATAALAVSHL